MFHMKLISLASLIAFASLAAKAEVPMFLPDTPSIAVMPRLSMQPAPELSARLVDRTIYARTLPGLTQEQGRLAAMQRLAEDPVKQSHAIGHLAEEDFVLRNPAWHKTACANAPENDIWAWCFGELRGGQIKTHRSGDPAEYLRDMFKDRKAEYFLVPDDHAPALDAKIRQQLGRAEQAGNPRVADEWRSQLGRVRKLGRTYAEMDRALLERVSWVVRRSQAVRTAAAGGLITFTIDGAIVVYRSSRGELTPTETVEQLGVAAAKGAAVGTAAAASVLLGANPIGFTVIVVGGVTYIVVDYAVERAVEAWHSTPLSKAQIEAVLPEGWSLDVP
jgi:hypothetical protein